MEKEQCLEGYLSCGENDVSAASIYTDDIVFIEVNHFHSSPLRLFGRLRLLWLLGLRPVFRFASGEVRVRFGFASGVDQVWFTLGSGWFCFGSGLIHLRFRCVSGLGHTTSCFVNVRGTHAPTPSVLVPASSDADEDTVVEIDAG